MSDIVSVAKDISHIISLISIVLGFAALGLASYALILTVIIRRDIKKSASDQKQNIEEFINNIDRVSGSLGKRN
jgi:hypothetical protein